MTEMADSTKKAVQSNTPIDWPYLSTRNWVGSKSKSWITTSTLLKKNQGPKAQSPINRSKIIIINIRLQQSKHLWSRGPYLLVQKIRLNLETAIRNLSRKLYHTATVCRRDLQQVFIKVKSRCRPQHNLKTSRGKDRSQVCCKDRRL